MSFPHNRREFLKSAGLGVGSLGLGAQFPGCSSSEQSGAESAAPAAGRPNIVLIMADDLGYETLGCYGGTSYKTPNLDDLARSGLRFNHAYAQPLCTPTRLQLMTGQYNFRNWQAFGILDPNEKTFGHMMQAAGYKTCIAGKWQLYSYNPPDFMPEWRGKGMRGEQAGFDDYFLWHAEHTEDKGSRYANPKILDNGEYLEDTEGQYGPDLYAAHINAFMEQHRDDPFFVYYPMALTHGPFNPTPNSSEWATGDRLQNDPRFFKDMVEYMDIVVGRVVKKIDELGLRERTLILYYGDNGSPREVESQKGEQVVTGGKGYMTDAGTRVPLIANWQGVCPPGRVSDDLVDSTDFIPTMIEATGAKPLDGMLLDGQSFLPQVRGEPGKPREWVLVDHNPHPGWDKERFRHERFARDQRFKLYGDGRLFDISADVLEEKEIPGGEGSPEAQAAREKLQAVLDRMRK